MRSTIAVYKSGDIVSNTIKASGVWEAKQLKRILRELHTRGQNVTFVDIGANIGWFALNVAAAGYRVIAVEPFEKNLQLLNWSTWANDLRDKILIIPSGLSNKRQTCDLYQQPRRNIGDTHSVCDEKSRVSFKKKKYVKLSSASFERADAMSALTLCHSVVKIDVEGYEPLVWEGADKKLRECGPDIIISEYNPQMSLRASGVSEKMYFQNMRNRGYHHTLAPNEIIFQRPRSRFW